MRAPSSGGNVSVLLERLTQRTQAEMKAKREHAQSEIERMEQEAAERRRAQRDEMLRACAADVEANAATAVSTATLEARRELLDAQHALVCRVLTLAREEIPALLASERLTDALLDARLGKAAGYASETPLEIRCPRDLAARVEQRARVLGLDARIVADDAVGSGVLVSDASGRLTIDDTLETRLARLGTELTIEICRMAEEEVA